MIPVQKKKRKKKGSPKISNLVEIEECIKKFIKKLRERERENIFFVREKYIKNGRVNEKFIVRGCEKERTKKRKMKGKMKSDIKVDGSEEMKS